METLRSSLQQKASKACNSSRRYGRTSNIAAITLAFQKETDYISAVIDESGKLSNHFHMKNTFLLSIPALLLSGALSAQQPVVAETQTQTKRITITTKTVDDAGNTITETWIAEGDNPQAILKEMALQTDKIDKVIVEGDRINISGEQLFMIKAAGNEVVIEGRLTEVPDGEIMETEMKFYSPGNTLNEIDKEQNATWNQVKKVSIYAPDGHKSNCAALGVWTTPHRGKLGARITGLIEKGGAAEAGLAAGDLILRIDEFEVLDYPSLQLAMSHFLPGDVVSVAFNRGGASHETKVKLKDWAELPGHEWRSGGKDCLRDEPALDRDTPGDIIGNSFGPDVQWLELQDVSIYPNPVADRVILSFETEPGKLDISVSDISGKVVYRENIDNHSGIYQNTIDLTGNPEGQYIITVRQGDKVYSQQITKQAR